MTNKYTNTITEILADIRSGKMVILVDDEDRENEGDLMIAAEHITTEAVNFMATYARGLICLPLSESHCQKLGLSMMTKNNLSSHRTAFTVSIEAAKGVSTGISAADRAHTIKTAVAKDATAADIVEPGHIFPLKAKKGGVLTRAGHTEAACDLARLAGLSEAGVICEILNQDGSMARFDDLQIFAKQHNLKIGTIADLINFRISSESFVEKLACEKVNIFGDEFLLHIFRENTNDSYHIALTHGINIDEKFNYDEEVLVRVHFPFSEFDFIQGEEISKDSSFAMLSCLKAIKKSGRGALIGLRSLTDEDKKINKAVERITKLQKFQNNNHNKIIDDTKSSKNWDPKIYGTGAQIIRDLGIHKMRLLSHPINLANLRGFGLEIVDFVIIN